MRRGIAAVGLSLIAAFLLPAATSADPVTTPIEEGLREQSCKSLAASTVGLQDQTSQDQDTGAIRALPAAPAGLLPSRVYLRTQRDTFNRRYAFATRRGEIYVQEPGGSDRGWHQLQLPLCFDGRVASIAVDDDELIALDRSRRIFTMDNALKDASLFNWTSRWGTPFWTGPGYQLPDGIVAWSWSVVSPVEDGTWTDPAGNHQAIGSGKVSHIWALRTGGQHLSFWDPWLPLDESYGICGPYRGRFKAVNLSASGSTMFVIGRNGDMFTRIYDFDLSGHDRFFLKYSYEDQRGKGDSAPLQLPPFGWVHQPKIPGRITSAISINKVGKAVVHRTLRVEGLDGSGRSGYWEKDITQMRSSDWRFHLTGQPFQGHALANPRRDSSRRGLGRADDLRYASTTSGLNAEVPNFNLHCSPSRLRIRPPGARRPLDLILHAIDGLRQQPRASGLDNVPREMYGDIEVPKKLLGRPFVRSALGGRRFTDVTLEVTAGQLQVKELGWTFKRQPLPHRR